MLAKSTECCIKAKIECSYALNYERYEYNKCVDIFQIDCYMYKAMNNLLPTHMSNYFVKNNVLHDHYTW